MSELQDQVTNLPTSLDALVEHLREADTGGERDVWESADLALSVIGDKLPLTASGSGAFKSSSSELLESSFRSEAAREAARGIVDELIEQGILINGREPKHSTLLTWAQTAQIWPTDERVPEASFYAHRALNSPKYDGRRRERLLRLLAQSSTGRVTETAVRLWIRDRKPGEKQTFLQLVERRLRSAVKSAASPWEATAESDREKIAQILRIIANEIEGGTF